MASNKSKANKAKTEVAKVEPKVEETEEVDESVVEEEIIDSEIENLTAKTEVIEKAMSEVEEVKSKAQKEYDEAFASLVIVRN